LFKSLADPSLESLYVFNLKYEEGRDTVVGCSMAAEHAKRMGLKKRLLARAVISLSPHISRAP
jgi:hypothetical protein